MLDQLGMIGISWRQGSAESLAGFTLDSESIERRLRGFAAAMELKELGYLATCNRVELIFSRSDATPLKDLRKPAFELLTGREAVNGEAERRLRAWQGEGAAEHLFLIAAGLDSACVGETEIVGQVRLCHERSVDMGLSGPVLDLVFDEAQRIAARVRGETRVATGRVSLAEIAVDHLRRQAAAAPGTIAIVGVSPMTERAARSLAALGMPLVFVNRSAEKAQALARSYGSEHMPLALFLANPRPVTALLTSTGADHAVLPDATLERLAAHAQGIEGLLIVDMAVPPDAEPESCKRFGIRRIGLDEIVAQAEHNRAARLIESADAREQVDQALEGLHERIAEKYYGPLLGTLQKRYKRTAEEGIERLLKRELDGLGGEERAAIRTWCEVLARRFAHIPCMGLRGLMQSGPEGSIEAFLSGLEPEFADELRAALGAGKPPRGAVP